MGRFEYQPEPWRSSPTGVAALLSMMFGELWSPEYDNGTTLIITPSPGRRLRIDVTEVPPGGGSS